MFYQTSSNIRRKELWGTKFLRVPQQFQRDGICGNAPRMREPNMIDTPAQTNQTSSNKLENKRLFDVV